MTWRFFLSLALVGIVAATVWVTVLWQVAPWPAPLSWKPVVTYPGAYVTLVATFQDEIFAYLMFQHYRHSAPLAGEELLLTFDNQGKSGVYRLLLVLGPDYADAVERAARMAAARQLEDLQWKLLSPAGITNYRNQSRVFDAAFQLPVKRKMEELSPAELRTLLHRFLRFKSTTDPRVRKRLEPVPAVLTPKDSQRLAGDILAVAEFYDLPLEYLLGIGAMENNYMNVRGDLQHSIWKRRPAKDDIVLEKKRGRVRVLNDSAGVWQITRETLRYVHKLYLEDTRDYGKLPEHLRPPRELDVNAVDPDVLTTYAGLLLRDLLDYFQGDVAQAVGAYNGGRKRPNARYQQGVEAAAMHARKVLEQAAALNGESVMEISWLAPH